MGAVWATSSAKLHRAALAARQLGLLVLILGLGATGGSARAALLQIAGNHAYFPNQFGALTVASISNASPAVIATYPNLEGIKAIALHGQYALVSADDGSVHFFDVSGVTPEPLMDARYFPYGPAQDIRMNGAMAFVAEGVEGVGVVDMFEPNLPARLARLTPDGEAQSVDLAGNRLCVACGGAGLKVYDVTDTSSITNLASRATATPARQVRTAGGLAYVACDGGRLEIVNLATAPPTLLGTYQASGRIADIDIAGSHVALAITNGTLIQLNVSNPSAPVLRGAYPVSGGATAVRIVGATAYVRNGSGNLKVIPLPGLAPVAPSLQEGVEPVFAPAGQKVVLSVLVSGTPPLAFQWFKAGTPLIDDGRLFGTTGPQLVVSNALVSDSGSYSVTVSNMLGQIASSNLVTIVNPGAPVLRGSFNPSGSAQALDTSDYLAYVACGAGGLEIYDVFDPRFPVRFGGTQMAGTARGVHLLGGLAWVAADTNGLLGFSTAALLYPDLVSSNTTFGVARAVQEGAGYLFVAADAAGVFCFDPTTLPQPTQIGTFDTPGSAQGLYVVDGRAYIADGSSGLQILAVTNPAAITSLGSYDTPGETRSVKVRSNIAYVADGMGGLVVLDVANPSAPTLLGTFATAGPVVDLEIIENIAVLALGTNGVETVNVANPAAMTSLGALASVAPANAVRLEGARVYVATGTNGVQILELAGLAATYPTIAVAPQDQVALPGQGVNLEVVGSGTPPLRYQWFHNGVPLTETADVHGVSTATLSLTNLVKAASGEYRVVVRNAWNLSVLASAAVAVVPPGTPVFRRGYFDSGDVLNAHLVGQTAFVANRLHGLQVIDCRDPMNPVKIGETNTTGLAQDVQVRGRYAYVACWDAGLQIFDVLDPTNLVFVGQCPTPGFARSVRVAGQRAYVANRQGGQNSGGAFTIIDITDPAHPTVAGVGRTTGFAEGLEVADTKVFIAAAGSGLEIFDAADALAPTRIARLDTPGSAESVTLVSNRLYLADYNRGLQIIEVTNPAVPLKLGEFQTTGDAFQVQVMSNRAYVATGIRKVEVVDVATPSQPAPVSTGLGASSVHGVQLVGHYALLADRDEGLLVSELLGFGGQPPQVLDFATNRGAAVGHELVLSVNCAGTPPLNYQWRCNGTALTATSNVSGGTGPLLRFVNLAATNAGNYEVVISSPYGSTTSAVATVNVQTNGTPVVRGVFDTPGTATAATSLGNIAFVADGSAGLRLVNLTNLDAPTALGAYLPATNVQGLMLTSNLLFLALGTNGVEIVDAGRLPQLSRLSSYDTPGTALNLDVANGCAYVADGTAGLQILSVTNPSVPAFLGAYDSPGTASDVRVSGSFACLADGASGLLILSVTNPAAPVLLASLDTPGPATAVRLFNHRAYVACGNGGLVVADVQNPAAPVALGTNAAVNAAALDLAGALVVVADGTGDYRFIDAADPAAMVDVGSSASGDAIHGATLVGNLALLSSGTNGLRLVELAGVSAAAPTFLAQPVGTSVLHGGTARFQALPTGTPPLTYRWYFKGLPLFDGTNIAGAATEQLTVSNVALADAGNYTLRVLNPWGVTNSAPAPLTFIGPLQAQLNAAAPGAVINLTTGIYSETLTLDKDVTLAGAWWNPPVFDAGGMVTTVRVLPGANVTLRGLAVRGGANPTGGGGAILNQGNLTLEQCWIADSTAETGAGICNQQNLRIFSCILSNNTATGAGGGLANEPGATTWITNSTLLANSAREGGGIYNRGGLAATNSLVASNLATGSIANGGGISHAAGSLQLTRCTVSGNRAQPDVGSATTGLGGGVRGGGGTVEFLSSTVAFNTAGQDGGGLSIDSSAAVYALNSLFARNTAPSSPDYGGAMNSKGFNLVENAAGTVVLGSSVGVVLNLDARLAPLSDNGGPTLTHALLPDSPAIDAGASEGSLTDQRGIPQPFDVPWFANAWDSTDVGAFEFVDRSPYLGVSNRVADSFTLVWTGGGFLQQSAGPAGPWTELTNSSPILVTTSNAAAFFRLRQPTIPALVSMENPSGDGFTLAWQTPGILEHAPATSGPWQSLDGISPRTVHIQPGQSEFFRLRVIEH